MPVYEYVCKSCEHEWTEEKSIKADVTKVCPECEEESAKRLISKSSFALKGSGWFNSGGY